MRRLNTLRCILFHWPTDPGITGIYLMFWFIPIGYLCMDHDVKLGWWPKFKGEA